MRLNTVVLVLVLAALAVFAALNLNALLFPHTVYYWFGRGASLPLGMILVVLIAVVALLFTLLASLADLRAQASSARTLREMEALRQSLDKEEASRFAQLQAYLQERFGALQAGAPTDLNAQLSAQLGARVDRVRDELSADIGQLEDYLKRKLGDAPPNRPF